MSPKLLEKKIDRMEKDLAFIKKLVLASVKKPKKSSTKEVLSNWAMGQIALAEKDIKAGRVYSLEKVKERYGL